jgi:hypothetical protein
MSKGVLQGSVLSPLIFNIYIDSLIRDLQYEFNRSSQVYAYADDLMVVTHSILRCKKAIEIINKWCRNNKMELNRKKSGIL